ncbi:MAG: helix-turn-helix domain-containing protein [Candidatus Eisenbacteria bacterium]|nr:helix-turn-helix domain-containing protein [Candidatus Latescibacterota bacterium]MBD3302576.1 helix-turn-helix domain-containing protein [Candidatus Eisenbacteria bacterium]
MMVEEGNRSLGTRINEIRRERGMTLADLEETSGVTKGYLSQLERGIKSPSLETVEKVARGLGVYLSDLVLETRGSEDSPEALPPALAEFVRECEQGGIPLTAADVKMLVGIRYRGKQPKTPHDWAMLFYLIRGMTV